jgi:hypothetical protein
VGARGVGPPQRLSTRAAPQLTFFGAGARRPTISAISCSSSLGLAYARRSRLTDRWSGPIAARTVTACCRTHAPHARCDRDVRQRVRELRCVVPRRHRLAVDHGSDGGKLIQVGGTVPSGPFAEQAYRCIVSCLADRVREEIGPHIDEGDEADPRQLGRGRRVADERCNVRRAPITRISSEPLARALADVHRGIGVEHLNDLVESLGRERVPGRRCEDQGLRADPPVRILDARPHQRIHGSPIETDFADRPQHLPCHGWIGFGPRSLHERLERGCVDFSRTAIYRGQHLAERPCHLVARRRAGMEQVLPRRRQARIIEASRVEVARLPDSAAVLRALRGWASARSRAYWPAMSMAGFDVGRGARCPSFARRDAVEDLEPLWTSGPLPRAGKHGARARCPRNALRLGDP